MTQIPAPISRRVDPTADAEALRALRMLGPLPTEWVPARAGVDHDVAIVGGGQNGVALAFALRRQGVHRVTVIDAAVEEDVGVWRQPARMNVLRTPKSLVGPELGIAELSFRHWFEARRGADAYDAITFIKRTDWADYLDWYREIVKVQVRFGTTLALVEPAGDHLRLHLRRNGEESIETARKLVLASGVAGFGGAYIPAALAENLPPSSFAHSSEIIDFSHLRGKAVAVLGSAASAFDAAAAALESGAAEVHLFSRRPAIANQAPARLRGHAGAVQNFHALPDAVRWRFNIIAKRYGTTPPREALLRLAEQPDFHIHLNAEWERVRHEDGAIAFTSDGRNFRFDYAIAGTGYHSDAGQQAELRAISPDIARWGDRYTPPADLADSGLAGTPYLGPAYQLEAKHPGMAPYLKNIHVYSAAAATSFGRPVGDVPCMATCLPNLANAIVRDLYLEDAEVHWACAEQNPPEDFPADLYAHAVHSGNPAVIAGEE